MSSNGFVLNTPCKPSSNIVKWSQTSKTQALGILSLYCSVADTPKHGEAQNTGNATIVNPRSDRHRLWPLAGQYYSERRSSFRLQASGFSNLATESLHRHKVIFREFSQIPWCPACYSIDDRMFQDPWKYLKLQWKSPIIMIIIPEAWK